MEFIQCPHCQKKYAVGDQLRAATGKKIRCKHCSEAFEIQIQQTSPTPIDSEITISEPTQEKIVEQTPSTNSDETTPEPAQQQPLEEEQKKNQAKPPAVKAKKKKLNIQLVISIVLLLILIAGAIGAYLFFNKESLFSDSAKSEPQSIIPHDIIKPIEFKLPSPNTAKTDASMKPEPVKKAVAKLVPPTQQATVSKEVIKPLMNNKDDTPLSQVCKDISADYWVRSHTLATVSMDTATYMKLLNQNLEQADEIRKLCKDKRLIGKIAKAARANQKPVWIAQEISLRINTAQEE